MKISLLFFVFMMTYGGLVAQSCSVLCLNDQWLVKNYDRGEMISIPRSSQGTLSARVTGDIALRSFIPDLSLKFKIAIRREYETLEMFSEKTYTKYPLEQIIAACQPGEAIVVLLADNKGQFALPHHVIELTE